MWRQGKTRMMVVGLFVMSSVIVGCAGHEADHGSELQALADAGDYKEIEARVQLYHGKGESSSQLDYYEGLALLAQDEDVPAARSFEKAVGADSSLAPAVADLYRKAAQADWEEGWKGRATSRMKRAYELDGVVEMGELGSSVAEALFDEKKLKEAIPIYRHLLVKGGDPEQRQLWLFHLALSLEQSGSVEAGLQAYRDYWKEFPPEQDTRFDGGVTWRQGVILLDLARSRMEDGDYQGALDHLNELLSLPPRALLRIQTYYLAGRCQEELGRPEKALQAYKEVLKFDVPGPGGEREKARERVAALEAEGIR